MKRGMMNWEKMEFRLREVLESYRQFQIEPSNALQEISDIIGEETGRGYPLAEKYSKAAELKAEAEKPKEVCWMSEVPTHCQICPTELPKLFIDGKTVHGPWAILCKDCHMKIGVGLGTGKGQQYELHSNGKWLKTAG